MLVSTSCPLPGQLGLDKKNIRACPPNWSNSSCYYQLFKLHKVKMACLSHNTLTIHKKKSHKQLWLRGHLFEDLDQTNMETFVNLTKAPVRRTSYCF